MAKAKRGNSEGSIYQRADGRWVAALSLPGGRRKHLYGKSRREVADKLTRAAAMRDKGMPLLDETVTVSAFLRQWLDDVVQPNARPRTLDSYRMHVRLHLEPAIGKIRLARLTPADVQRMMNEKSAAGLQPATVNRIRATLRSALNHALRWGMVTRNAAALAIPPRAIHYEIAPLTPDDARVMLQAAAADHHGPLYIVALTLGLRLGEVLGLAWDDIDFEAGTLSVRRTLTSLQGKPQVGEPKSARSRRTLPMPAVVVDQLIRRRGLQQAERLLAGSRWRPRALDFVTPGGVRQVAVELVFTSSVGGPLDDSMVRKRFYRLLDAAGLPHMRFHDLRHSCATFLLAQGTSPRVVMEIMGHSSIGLTMNTYAHVLPGALRDAVDRMDALLGTPDNVNQAAPKGPTPDPGLDSIPDSNRDDM